jgi:hypothetical protein
MFKYHILRKKKVLNISLCCIIYLLHYQPINSKFTIDETEGWFKLDLYWISSVK